MKNRVLSVLLSIGIIFSNFSTSFVAIAEGDETASTETTETIKPTNDPTEGNTDDDMINSDSDEEPSEDELNPDSEENPDDEDVEDERTVISVSFKEGKKLTIYNGQEGDLDYIYNFPNNDGKPRYVDFFKFESTDWSDEMYENIVAKFEKITEGVEENKTVFSLNFVFENSELDDVYKIECANDFVFELSIEYTPRDISVPTIIGQDGNLYLKCDNLDYAVSTTNVVDSFSESADTQVMLSGNEAEYYLRNINAESIEYHAISTGFQIESSAGIEILQDALIMQNDIDFSKISAYNKAVTVEITAYAKAANATIALWNDNKMLPETEMKRVGTEHEKNKFTYEYTFEVPASGVLHITNLKVQVTAGKDESEAVLALKDTNGNTCTDFRLENNKPLLYGQGGPWNHEKNMSRFQIQAKDFESDIISLDFSFDKINWNSSISEVSKNNIYPTGVDIWLEFIVSNSELKERTLYFRAIDEAGNMKIIYRDPVNRKWTVDGEPDSNDFDKAIEKIKGIELYYLDAADNYTQITDNTILHIDSFGNSINKPIQIRIKSDEKNTIYVNDSLMKKATKTITSTVGDETVEEVVFDYFYYDFDLGTNSDVVLKINGTDVSLASSEIIELLGLELESNHLIVENTKPTATLERPGFAVAHVSVSNKWYGIKEKDEKKYFEIEVIDEKSGIKSLAITDNGTLIDAAEENPIEIKINESQETTKITSSFSQQAYGELTEATTNVKVKIPIALFDDGDHVLEIKFVDNAGNSETGFVKVNGDKNTVTDTESEIITNKPFVFSTDFTRPTGVITIASKSKSIDGKDWFALDKVVEFEFAISDTNPNKVSWKANSNAQSVEMDYPVGETKIEASLNDTTAALAENNSYTISAVFYDQAGNSSEDGSIDAKTFYKDTQNPEIDTVSVSCAPEKGIDKIFRILTFGVFAKDTITVYVTANDGEHDSGLNGESLAISLDGGETYNEMTYDDGKYKYPIKATDTPTSGIIALRVTDQFGNYSEEFEEILKGDGAFSDSADSTVSNDFVVETIAPNVKVTIPTSDGITRTDSNIWYNSDKDIIIEVQDEDSGIRNIHVLVNEEPVYSDSDNVNFISECIVKDTETHKYRLSTEDLREILRNSNKLSGDGCYTIKITVEDNAGNENTSIALTVGEATSYTENNTFDYYLDYDEPVVQKIDFSLPSADEQSDADVSEYITELEYGYYFKTAVLATVNIYDPNPTSDLHRIEYVLVSYNNGVKVDEEPNKAMITLDKDDKTKGTANFYIPADFKGQILVTAYDYVQNESKETAPDLFVVDTPEKHESEKHIEIKGMGETAFSDAEKHPLFARDVELTVRVSDTMSGIREINYALDSEKITQDVKTITLQNSGYSVGQDIGDGWIIKSMDENLVTEVERVYKFSEDNNNIKLTIGMKDRAKNESSDFSDVFTVDQTAPIINVTFDSPDGNGDCYQRDRTATIKVVERNFDPAKIIPDIQNTYGVVPAISSFKDDSNTEHTATITFGEGDYTFAISGTDRCDHTATVNYSGGNEQSFRVDLTDPVIEHNFNELINDAENSFNTDKQVTITITEHNFKPELVKLNIYRADAGQQSADDDCTGEYVRENSWSSVGDTHTISFTFANDYVYRVAVSGMDASGRIIPLNESQVFEIDKTAPVLETPANLKALIYTTENKKIESIKFKDSNIAKVDYSVVSYRMKVNEEKIGYDVAVESKSYETMNNTVTISDEFFNQDGIYEVKCVPYDVAGNAGEETTHTYVIQREADFLVYIPNSNKENQTGLYKFDRKGIRSADFEDIEIVSYLTKDKAFTVEIDGVEIPSSDASSEIVNENINQVNVHRVVVKSSYIAQNFSEDTVDTDLTLNAVASEGNDSQIITLGHIYIDNVKPVGEYEKALQDIGFFDGFYGVESRTLMIEGVSPDIDLSKCEVMINDEVLTYENGGLQYDEDSHIISFTVDKGYTSIRTTLVDNAGNANSLAMIKKVYVGGLFARWWYLFILGGLIVLAIPTYIIFMIIRKKRNRASF